MWPLKKKPFFWKFKFGLGWPPPTPGLEEDQTIYDFFCILPLAIGISWFLGILNCFPCKTSQTDSVGLPSGRASPLWGGDGGARSSLDVSFRQTQVLVALNRLQTSNMVDSAFPHSVFHPMLFSKIIIWWHFPQETDVLQVQMLQSLTLETWQLTSWHLAHGS